MQDEADYDGVLIPREGFAAGPLAVAGANSCLTLLDLTKWEDDGGAFRDIHGTLRIGTKASLLDFVITERVKFRGGRGSSRCRHRAAGP